MYLIYLNNYSIW